MITAVFEIYVLVCVNGVERQQTYAVASINRSSMYSARSWILIQRDGL